jgi:hypothetical protein
MHLLPAMAPAKSVLLQITSLKLYKSQPSSMFHNVPSTRDRRTMVRFC